MTKKPAPTEVGNGTDFNNAGAQNLVSLHRNRKTSDPARLGYLSRLVDRQAQDAEHFDAMSLEQAKILLEGVREAQKRKDLPRKLRARLKRTEELGRKSVAAKVALARRPDYVPQPPRPSARVPHRQ